MLDYIQQVIDNPGPSALVILNLIIIESLLSIDNATVLAIMVKDLPTEQRKRALKIGIWCAYLFRGLAMLFVATLVKIWWLKVAGGLYLLFICFDWLKGKMTPKKKDDDLLDKKSNWFFSFVSRHIGQFWGTVIMVEMMDVAFSIDNVFAAVAFTPNIFLVCVGVFIGILTMRLVAQYFTVIIEKYPFLENSAMVVIFLLGLKLTLSCLEKFYPEAPFTNMITGHSAENILSFLSIVIFILPLITSKYFNYPKHK